MEQFERDAPLFDRRLQVLVQSPDREEKLQQLTIRLLHGVRQNSATNQKERVFRVEITDDDGADPYFLYLWSVSEEEFHELKQQQRLLVDFAAFPTSLIELLQCCLQDSKKAAAHAKRGGSAGDSTGDSDRDDPDADDSAPSDTVTTAATTAAASRTGAAKSELDAAASTTNPLSRSQGPVPLSYLAVLQTCDAAGKSVFSIVETNPFKHLTHLSLQFFPGDDAAIKAYLAARLAQISAHKRQLTASLRATTSELKRTHESETQLQRQLDTTAQQTAETLARERMAFADDLNAQRERAAETLKQREDEFNDKLDALTRKFEDETRSLRKALEVSDASVQTLTKLKYQHELQLEQLQTQTRELGATKASLSDELQALRIQNKALDTRAFEQEKAVNTLEMRVTALQTQLTDREQVAAKTAELLQNAQAHKLELDESLQMYRENHARLQQKLELSISEINKGNEIIERIQNESHALRAKMRMKAKIIKQQEQILNEKQAQRDDVVRELKSTREDLRKRDDEIMALKGTVGELKQKLDESTKLLASNQQVITWLNKEINEAQIAHQRRVTAHPSVLSFRPSADKGPGAATGAASLRPPSTFTSHLKP